MRQLRFASLLALALLPAAEPAGAQNRELRFDTEAAARLGTPGDPERAGKPYHMWTFTADAPGTVQILMRSEAFDSYLVLQDTEGRFLSMDDNSGGGTNARLVYDVAAGGRYRILVRSLNDSTGAYNVIVRRFDRMAEGLVGPVTRGQDVTHTLAASDPTVNGGKPYRAWSFDGRAGDSLVVDMTSEAFDTYLIVQDSAGATVAENDDFEGLNSRIATRLTATGRYRIIATAFNTGATGAFRLRVQ